MVKPHTRATNIDEPPHINEIKTCDHTVEINTKALIRLLMIVDRTAQTNGSDRVAIGRAEAALGMDDVICAEIPGDLPDELDVEIYGPDR